MRGATLALSVPWMTHVIIQVPWAAASPPVSITAVYPSGVTVHENLLSVSIRFAAAQDPLLAA
ncbi:MAG: hypothetical protein M3Z23_17020 [Acidobacteriota bacterium]|nr:hypothetical protein [Acidobacteriota bacterium]